MLYWAVGKPEFPFLAYPVFISRSSDVIYIAASGRKVPSVVSKLGKLFLIIYHNSSRQIHQYQKTYYLFLSPMLPMDIANYVKPWITENS